MDHMKEITVVAKDRIGLLADISECVSNEKLNIESISVETSSQTAIIRLVVREDVKAKKALEGKGYKVLDTDILVLGLEDKPGELAAVSRMMADNKISIESVLILNKEGEKTVIALRTDDYKAARKLLKEKKYI